MKSTSIALVPCLTAEQLHTRLLAHSAYRSLALDEQKSLVRALFNNHNVDSALNDENWTALMALANLKHRGSEEAKTLAMCAEFFCAKGADVNLKDARGRGALWRACINANEELVNVLLKHGADANETVDKVTVLMQAAANANVRTCQSLVEAGAEVNALTANKNTALMYAADNANVETFQFLLMHGANSAAVDLRNWSVLDYANAAVRKSKRAGTGLNQEYAERAFMIVKLIELAPSLENLQKGMATPIPGILDELSVSSPAETFRRKPVL